MATSSTIANQGRRIEGGISINASGAQINAQGDVLSHNTIQVLPAPPLTAKEKERNLARFQRCPLPSVIFTGREEALRKICDRLLEPSTRTRIFVLYGLGGAGKSQITFQFVHTHCYGKDANVVPRIPIALFVDASTRQTIELSLTNIAATTGIGESAEDVLLFLPHGSQCKSSETGVARL